MPEGTEMRMMDPTPEDERPRLSRFRPIPSWRFKFVLPCPIRSVPRAASVPSPFALRPAKPTTRPRLKPASVGGGKGGGHTVHDEGGGGGGTTRDDSPAAGRERRASLGDDVNHWAAMGAASAAASAASATVSSVSTTSTVTAGDDDDDEAEEDDSEEDEGYLVDVDWPITNGEQHVLQWETDLLANLGADMSGFTATNTIGSTVVSTAMSAVLTTAMLPVTVLESVSSLDNPWSVASERVEAAGAQLAEVLLARVHGERPVTLIGYSMVGGEGDRLGEGEGSGYTLRTTRAALFFCFVSFH